MPEFREWWLINLRRLAGFIGLGTIDMNSLWDKPQKSSAQKPVPEPISRALIWL
jgi:hypothetical protein